MRVFRAGRGGRRFFLDFLVVALGVLVALALEHLLIGWRDRQRVDDTILSMNEELADFALVFEIRRRASPCAAAKLDAIDAALRAGSLDEPARNVGRPPFFFSSRGAWNSGAADLLARHIGPERFRTYGEAYQGMEEYAALSQREQDHWAALQTLEGDAGPIDPQRRSRLREATAAARNANAILTAIADQMAGRIGELGVERSAEVLPDIPGSALCLGLIGE